MARDRILQIYRGTTAQNDAFTGAQGELTMDTTLNELRVHDGITPGGHKIGGGYHPDLFTWQWADHELNDVQWLRADTYSWQSGAVYQAAYAHLADDIDGKTLQSETISGTTIQFYLADDGHKICPADQESNVAAIYSAIGVAWYYIIDTTNQRFKLPRTQFGVTGLRDTVGNYVAAGLPNITGGVNGAMSGQGTFRSGTGAFKLSKGPKQYGIGRGSAESSNNNYEHADIDASESNSIYGNSTTVQPPATQMYLYFYVGNFTQTALENTAGVTTETLNDKLDLDVGNATSTTKSTIVGWGMPDFSAGVQTASNTDYIAPSNGIVFVLWSVGTNKVYINDVEKFQYIMGYNTNFSGFIPIPVFKGTKIKSSSNSITFYPCIGG